MIGLLLGCTLMAQSFEVASVKPHEGPMPNIGISTSGVRLEAHADTVRGMILYAYGLKNYQLPDTPALLGIGDTFYDAEAKAEGDTPPSKADFRRMLRQLLADRSRLSLHRETREMSVYGLVVGKGSPKLLESAPDTAHSGHFGVSGRNYQVTLKKASMDDVVNAIANSFPDRSVIDRTGLTGLYDVKLTYTSETRSNRENPDPDDLSVLRQVRVTVSRRATAISPGELRLPKLILRHRTAHRSARSAGLLVGSTPITEKGKDPSEEGGFDDVTEFCSRKASLRSRSAICFSASSSFLSRSIRSCRNLSLSRLRRSISRSGFSVQIAAASTNAMNDVCGSRHPNIHTARFFNKGLK